GFDEIDAFIVTGLINRLEQRGWHAAITADAPRVLSMHGLVVQAQQPLACAHLADAVVLAGVPPRADHWVPPLRLRPRRQLIAARRDAAMVLPRHGLVSHALVGASQEPFIALGDAACAQGALAATHLAAWLLWRGAGEAAARAALRAGAPQGHEQLMTERV